MNKFASALLGGFVMIAGCGVNPGDTDETTESLSGKIDFNLYCRTTYGSTASAKLTSSTNAWSWVCQVPASQQGLDLAAACVEQHGAGSTVHLGSGSNPFSWSCTPGGGLDLDGYCKTHFGSGASVILLSNTNAYSWRCQVPASQQGMDLQAACVEQYGAGATVQLGSASDPNSWSCTAPDVACGPHGYDTIQIDSLTSPGFRVVNGVNYQVYGDPIVMQASLKSSRGKSSDPLFKLPATFDGAPVDQWVQPNPWETNWNLVGPTVTAATPTTHTLSVTTSCGTVSKQTNITKINPTAPVPTLAASSTYVNSNAAVTLTVSWNKIYSTCTNAKLRLVGRQPYDSKVVLDETYDLGEVLQKVMTVHPQITTDYTLTAFCTAFPSTQKSATQEVTVYGAQSVCPGGGAPATYVFCQNCPSGIPQLPPYLVELVETFCNHDDAEAAAQRLGTNCELTDGLCN